MINLKFICNKGNSPTQVYNTLKFNKYRLTVQSGYTESNIYYDGFLTDSSEQIILADWCIITNPYDGEEYTEQCKKVAIENNRGIFYGMEGTRCLLIDAVKIISTSDKLLKGVSYLQINQEIVNKYNCKIMDFIKAYPLE